MKNFKNQRNPILPLEHHIPDSEGHVMPDGKLYIYGSFDDREDVYCSDKYLVISTPDMENWTIHDVSLTGQQVSWFNNPDAPKYPGIDWTHPTPFIQKMLANMAADGEDMKEKFEKEEEDEKPPLLFAPDCIERDGKYYLYFCMSDDSEGVAVSEKPEGPFTNPVQLPCGGIDPASWNNHGSIELVNGQWYVFYHRCSRGMQQHRRLCIEPITINPDGTIDEVKMTSQGIGNPFAPGERIYGYQACGMKGTMYIGLGNEAEKARGYEEKIMNISAGDEAVFRYIKSDVPWKAIELVCTGSGKVRVMMKHVDGKRDEQQKGRKENLQTSYRSEDGEILAGVLEIEGRQGSIQTVSGLVTAPAGTYELTLSAEESEGLEIYEIVIK